MSASDYAPKPLLAGLPVELLRIIIPDPAELYGIVVDEVNALRQRWLAIKRPRPTTKYQSQGGLETPDETLLTLRSLSQTCHRLRQLTLPLLWRVCHVRTLSELGRLRETLRVSPGLATHIRCLSFVWLAGGDYNKMDEYKKQEGSLLAMAFEDRWRRWDNLRQRCGRRVEHQTRLGSERVVSYFTRSGKAYLQPGWVPADGEENMQDEYEWHAAQHAEGEHQFQWAYEAPNVGGHGPDGHGPDALINSPHDFESCMFEITAQLTSLQTFAWGSPVTPLPKRVCQTLEQLDSLTSLQVVFSTFRDNVYALPLWRLTRNLRHLSISPWYTEYLSIDGVAEQTEETFTSFEFTSKRANGKEARETLHSRVAMRTFIAAAKAGRLRRLSCELGTKPVTPIFAVRSLLQYWVGVEIWDINKTSWAGAAASLRVALAHASLSLDEEEHVGSQSTMGTASQREDRLLSAADVKALQQHLQQPGKMPNFVKLELDQVEQPITLYLPWLADDEALATQVADAWNEVVRRGEADKVRCSCAMCRERLALGWT